MEGEQQAQQTKNDSKVDDALRGEFKPPAGMKLIPEDKYKVWAEAANDLKRLKSYIPEDFDVTKLPQFLSEHEELKKKIMTEDERKNAELAKLREQTAKYKEQLNEFKNEIRRQQIYNAVSEELNNAETRGYKMPLKIVKGLYGAELEKLNPESENFRENMKAILAKAWDDWEAMLDQTARQTAKPPTPEVGYSPLGRGAEGMTAEQVNKEVENIMSNFGAVPFVPEKFKKGE